MTELLTAAQMRAIEQAAIESGQVTGLELMERAGHGVVEAVFEEWPELAAAPSKAAVLCGPGNNGGDGFVVARLLKEWGWEVEVYLFGDPARLPPDAKANHDRWCDLGPVRPYVNEGSDAFWLEPDAWGEETLIIDALFGTGLTRPVEHFGAFGWATQLSGRRGDGQPIGGDAYPHSRVVAVDMPSGICSDSGGYLRTDGQGKYHEDIRAHLTVSFHAHKLGHVLADGPAACGKVVVKGIGLRQPDDARIVRGLNARHHVDLGKRLAHKYDHGHALVLSGGASRTGAARLAARGALRIGAGLVTLGVPVAVRAQRTPYAVLDADALTAFQDDPKALFDMLHDKCVLTPHGGEFARLFPDIAEKLNALATKGPAFSKVDATREAARRAGCVVLFKGPDTVIAAPDGRCSINSAQYERAAPWLATAGSGDVLAGFITGLLARGVAPMQASEAAAWLHVECARSFGPGLIAEDLPEELTKVFRGLVS